MRASGAIVVSVAIGWWILADFAGYATAGDGWRTWLAFMIVGIFGLLVWILVVLVRNVDQG